MKNGVVLGLASLMFVPMGFCSESIPNVSMSQNNAQIKELADSIAQKLYDEQEYMIAFYENNTDSMNSMAKNGFDANAFWKMMKRSQEVLQEVLKSGELDGYRLNDDETDDQCLERLTKESLKAEALIHLEKDRLSKIVQKGLKNGVKNIQSVEDDKSLMRGLYECIVDAAIDSLNSTKNTVFDNVPRVFYTDFVGDFKEIIK